MTTPIPAGSFWAKYDSITGSWHPLIAHSADVAAVFARLIEDDSPLASRFARLCGGSRLPPEVRAALIYLAALHDFGKVNHGFQEKVLPPGVGRRWPADGHVKVVIDSLPTSAHLQKVVGEIFAPFAGHPLDSMGFFMAALCHHGRPYSPDQEGAPFARLWDSSVRPGWDPPAMIRRLIAHARSWSGVDRVGVPITLPDEPEFTHLFAGALTLADWVGSTGSIFRFAPEADDDPDGYWVQAQDRARRACGRIGLVPETRVEVRPGAGLLDQLFPKLFPKNEPTPLQRRVAEMPLPGPGARVLIESETGSGKTEAVLALYARLRAEGRVAGLVFALPTRATAAAMHERVVAAIPSVYPDEPRPTVALAMGGEHVRAEASEPVFAEDPRTYDDPTDRELAAWATSSAKKFLAAEIVVGTIDQVLLAGLLVKHAHLRLAMLSRHLLVVDELHSCDRYMAEVLAKVVDFHSAAGGVAAFMSATLSAVERRRYGGVGEESSFEEAVDRPYPVLAICAGPGEDWRDEPLDDPGAAERRREVAWSTVSEAEGVRAAVEAARAGACVCILRNTVDGARASVEAIRALGEEELLWRPAGSTHAPAYHSRYSPPDRKALDAAVLASYGKGDRAAGTILVATQVAEQSLDVDFDFMVTDLCPIDVLLQRVGRLHRHRRSRPAGYEEARVAVIAPEKPLIEYVRGDRMYGPNGWGPVYEDAGDLELTLRLIQDPGRSKIRIPEDNRELVERVYHPEPREALAAESESWSASFIVNEGKNLGRTVHAIGASIDFSTGYMENGMRFSRSQEVGVRTRLGDDRVRVELGVDVPCFHADPERADRVDYVDLPFRFVGGDQDELREPQVSHIDLDEERLQFYVNGKGPFRYDRDGWHWPGR